MQLSEKYNIFAFIRQIRITFRYSGLHRPRFVLSNECPLVFRAKLDINLLPAACITNLKRSSGLLSFTLISCTGLLDRE